MSIAVKSFQVTAIFLSLGLYGWSLVAPKALPARLQDAYFRFPVSRAEHVQMAVGVRF